jgi:flagellar basal-body rod protein FlgB
MTKVLGDMFTLADRIQMESLNQRMVRNEVSTANLANSEVPGYRAIGYDFEQQLQALMDQDDPFPMATTHPKHFKNEFTEANGKIEPDVYVRPTESIPEDGNTVDVDREMAILSQNQILYRGAVELLNRKLAILRYAISGGGR